MIASDSLMVVDHIQKSFGGVAAIKRVSFDVGKGKIVGLIGPNGSGKSTMVNVIAGELKPDGGAIKLSGQDITLLPPHKRARLGITRSFQMLRLFQTMSVEDNLVAAYHMRMRTSLLSDIFRTRSAVKEEDDIRGRARNLLTLFDLQKFAARKASDLSIGQQRMVELARGMICDPTVFLLDEPAAGLSPPNVDRLIDLIRRMRDDFGMTVLLVEHVMRVVRDVCDHVVVLDSGDKIAEGPPDAVVSDPAVIEAYVGTGWKRRAHN